MFRKALYLHEGDIIVLRGKRYKYVDLDVVLNNDRITTQYKLILWSLEDKGFTCFVNCLQQDFLEVLPNITTK